MSQHLYIGTYTDAGSRGIYRCAYSPASGELTDCKLAAQQENPSYLALSPDQRFLYAVAETDRMEGAPGGGLFCYRREADGRLVFRDKRPTGEGAPCHLLAVERFVYVANYTGGSLTQVALGGGECTGRPSTLRHTALGREGAPGGGSHVHFVAQPPGSPYIWVADLGLDAIFVYAAGAIDAHTAPIRVFSLPQGSGPRHLAFPPTLHTAYVVTEYTNQVVVVGLDDDGLPAECIQVLDTLPASFSGDSACAAIKMTEDGRFLYVTNRGHDSIAVFRADPHSGRLHPVQIAPCGGEGPRDICLSPEGSWMFSANQNAGGVTRLAVHPQNGTLGCACAALPTDRPVCLLFA